MFYWIDQITVAIDVKMDLALKKKHYSDAGVILHI